MSGTFRKVTQIIEPQYAIEGAGVLLRRSFSPSRANRFDPFNDPIEGPIVGFPMHPHRGIETVTYMLAGNTRHRDSLGNAGVIGPGDVQWMTSGRGIMHEEMPKRGPDGRVDGFQLWVNLPASEKMGTPRYQEVNSETIPFVEKEGVKVRVVAGEFGGVKGPVTEIAAKPVYMDVSLQPGKAFSLELEADHTLVVYVFEGKGLFGVDEAGDGEWIEAVKMVRFSEGTQVRIEAGQESPVRFMFMAGGAFHEAIVPYGPFVMNTEAEIQQAFVELRNGTFVKD
jgi:redox-sensitive bicupin YhaK (pirin superfamily)